MTIADDSRIADLSVHLRFTDALQIQVALRARLAHLRSMRNQSAWEVSIAQVVRVVDQFEAAMYPESPEGGLEQYQAEDR